MVRMTDKPWIAPHAADLVRARAQLGGFEMIICTDGTYRLDGGAMFGVVPKTLWQKRSPADEQNRILLGLNTVVVRTGSQTVVIETGINVQVPLFIKTGEKIKIDTRTGKYMERA